MSLQINQELWCVAIYFKDKEKKEKDVFSARQLLREINNISEIYFKKVKIVSFEKRESDYQNHFIDTFKAIDSADNIYYNKVDNLYIRCFNEVSTLLPFDGEIETASYNLKEKKAFPFIFILTDVLDFLFDESLNSENELKESLNLLLNKIVSDFKSETGLNIVPVKKNTFSFKTQEFEIQTL